MCTLVDFELQFDCLSDDQYTCNKNKNPLVLITCDICVRLPSSHCMCYLPSMQESNRRRIAESRLNIGYPTVTIVVLFASTSRTMAQTSFSPTSAPTPCSSVICSDYCTGSCGWDDVDGACRPGGVTGANESNLGACNCSLIVCSDNCIGHCGWSVQRNSCILGGRTTASEGGLGVCPTVPPTPVDPAALCLAVLCSADCNDP